MLMRLLRCSEVEVRCGICRASIYDKMEKGNFPRSVEVTGRTVAWVEAEVGAWIASRIAERDVTKNHDRSKRTRKATEARKAMSSPMTPALRGSRGICARGSPTRSQMFQIRVTRKFPKRIAITRIINKRFAKKHRRLPVGLLLFICLVFALI
jgi:prophage regulatory protein